jgi:hypothetical protein
LDEAPAPAELARLYSAQFSNQRLVEREAQTVVLRFLEAFDQELRRESGLRALYTQRLAWDTRQLVLGLDRKVDDLRLQFGRTLPELEQSSAVAAATTMDRDAVMRAFGAASRLLLGWPQYSEGDWIERPELERLHALALQSEPVLCVLLGEPGGGKSALLARLGNRLMAEGVVLLALKADQLPRAIATLADLDAWIGAPTPVADSLRCLAGERRVVLLIDQLDALAELMDQHSQRLSALLRLVDAVSGVPNLQVVLSCREFEFRNDVRLATLKAETVTLARPAWEQVRPLLAARGLDPERWSDEVHEVLCTPQHLAMFLKHFAPRGERPTFTTYHGLLERLIERLERDCGPRTIEAAEHIATAMGEEEELSLGAARFDRAWREELAKLEAAGVLIYSDDRLSLTFRHQTLFEFLRSRAFLRDGVSIDDYVLRETRRCTGTAPR